MRRRSKRKAESEETCYMCDKPSVTREHAPPLAFFPSDRRGNLITVPSCTSHNNDNSKDVEYIRNIVVTDINTNELARSMFRSKVLPSFRRSPKLKRQTFARYREVFVWGMNSAVVDTDPARLNKVMKAIASALYFHDFGEKFGYPWSVHGATMVPFSNVSNTTTPQMNALFRSIPTTDRDTNQPDVFKYGVYRSAEYGVIYKLVFYGGVDFYVFGVPPGSRLENRG